MSSARQLVKINIYYGRETEICTFTFASLSITSTYSKKKKKNY